MNSFLAPQIPRLVSAIVLVALSVGPGASAATDISTLATGANTAVTMARSTDSVWTVNNSATVGALAFTRTGGNQTITLSGSGAAALIFSNSSIPNWTTSSQYSSYDYVSNLNIVSSSGLVFTGKSNTLVLQPGVSMAGVSGTFTLSNGNSDGSMIFAQGEGVLPSNATFLMIGGSGTNGYGYSKLVLNGGTTQTIGALNSSGNASNIHISAWNGSAALLTGGAVSQGTNANGQNSPATLRIGNNNASGTFHGVIGSGASTGSVITTDAGTRAIHLVKTGTGTQTFGAANTYNGSTTVDSGILALSGSGSISGTSALSIAAGATLDASAQTQPSINLTSTSLTLGVSSASRGFVNVGNGTLSLGSSLTLNLNSSTPVPSCNLYDAGVVSGSFSLVVVTGAIGTGSLVKSAGSWAGTVGACDLSLDEATGVLTIDPNSGGAPPDAPAELTAIDGFEGVTLTWTEVSGAVSYTVKRSTTPGSGHMPIATGVTGTTYTDTTAVAGTTYEYVVTAVNANGEGDPSPSDSGVVNVRAAIGINLRASNTYGLPVTDTAGVVRKAWWNNLVGPSLAGQIAGLSDVRDHAGNPVSGFNATFTAGTTSATGGATVKYGSDSVTVGPSSNDLNLYSSVFDQYSGTASMLAITGIPYVSYDLVVYVYDGGSSRGGVITANGVTLAVRGGAGSPAADGTGYVRSSDATHTSGSSVQQGNYVRFAGLTGDLSVSFQATNMGDSTQRLKIAGFQILSNDVGAAADVPPIPTGLTASGGNRQVALNWTHRHTAASYRIYRNGSLLATVSAPLSAFPDINVSNGTSYSYMISAVNAAGESDPSPPVSAIPSSPPFTAEERDVYQFSIPVPAIFSGRAADPMRRAYLWVPSGATRLQGVIVGLHNMLEKPMFEDPVIRQACADAGLGIVFISPGDSKTWTSNGVGNYTAGPYSTALTLDPESYDTIDTNPATAAPFSSKTEQAAAELAEILRRLGAESGYTELEHAPILLTGHSAASPFVWTRGMHSTASLNGRVFALLPYKGYFPGSISDGMPVLHVASEWQEISNWGNTWELGDGPGTRSLRAGAGGNRLLGALVHPGTGHYHYSETQSGPIACFIKATAALRIPPNWNPSVKPVLQPMVTSEGCLVDVNTLGSGNAVPVAYPEWVSSGKDPLRAYWYPDLATAGSCCEVMNAGFSKRPQLINAFSTATASSPANLAGLSNGEGFIRHHATLLADGVTFQLRACSLNQSPIPKLLNGAPVGIPLGSIRFKANRSGGLKQTGADTFRVWLDRCSLVRSGQPWEPFVIAFHPGDENYRGADRPIFLSTSVTVNLTSSSGGSTQSITFPVIPNQSADALSSLDLAAASSAGASYPVQYWMLSGPYRNDGINSGTLVPEAVPAGARFPMRVVVGAWQWGKPGVYQSATPVYQTFWIFRDSFQKWQFEKFGIYDAEGVPDIPAGESDATSDADGDGLANLIEYASGSDPLNHDCRVSPGWELSPLPDRRLRISFQRIGDPALTYTVQAVDSLSAEWTDIWSSSGTANTAGPVVVSDTQDASTRPRRFLRLKVTR